MKVVIFIIVKVLFQLIVRATKVSDARLNSLYKFFVSLSLLLLSTAALIRVLLMVFQII